MKVFDDSFLYQETLLYSDRTRQMIKRIVDRLPSMDIVHCYECKYAHMTYDAQCKYCDMRKDDEGHYIELYLDKFYYCADGERSRR